MVKIIALSMVKDDVSECLCTEHYSHNDRPLVSWCFEASQPQRIILGLTTSINLSPSYLFHKSLCRRLRTDLLQALKGEPLRSVFSRDGT